MMKQSKPAQQSLEGNLAELLSWVDTCDQDRLDCHVEKEIGKDGKASAYEIHLNPKSKNSLSIAIDLFQEDLGFRVSSFQDLKNIEGLEVNETKSKRPLSRLYTEDGLDTRWSATEDIVDISWVIGVCQCIRDATATFDILAFNGSAKSVRATYPTETSPTVTTNTGWPMFLLPLLRLIGRAEIVRLDYEPW